MSPPVSVAAPAPDAGPSLARLSNQIVRLTRAGSGRGPTSCRTSWAGRDTVVAVVREWMTTAERTLHEHGHADEIKAAREALDELVEIGLRREAEVILGRPVVTVLTARRCSDDTASHVLLLAPAASSENGGQP